MKKWRIAIGLITIVAAAILFWKKRIPIYEDITLNVVEAQNTPALMPGDCLKQDMYAVYDHVEKISVAFSYQQEMAEETEALIELTADEEVVMSQVLRVNACANQSFVDLYIDLDNCKGKNLTISVSNVTPEAIPGGEFALMSTDKEFLFADTVNSYRINGEETDSYIFCRSTYIAGYTYYQSLTYAFLVLLTGTVIMERLTRSRLNWQ